jgi:toxin ParE1/3/4
VAAEADALHGAASQRVREVMRQFIEGQRQTRDCDQFLQRKVNIARLDACRPQRFKRKMWKLNSQPGGRDWPANNAEAAFGIDTLFTDTAAILAEFPFAGPSGKAMGARELIPHESYRLAYEDYNQTVRILAIAHTAREWPPPAP